MRKSLSEIGNSFDTDKARSGYTDNYENHLGHLRDSATSLLELGVHRGGSLLMWEEYFSRATICGLDINPNPFADNPSDRIKFYQGSQADTRLLNQIATEHAPEGFDIIIDDAAHVGSLSRASLIELFTKHLKSGGTYVIEDWGTGYWDTWPDGNLYQPSDTVATLDGRKGLIVRTLLRRMLRHLGFSPALADNSAVDPGFPHHNFGMVGLVKELIDQVAWGDITKPGHGNKDLAGKALGIKKLEVYQGQVFIEKL